MIAAIAERMISQSKKVVSSLQFFLKFILPNINYLKPRHSPISSFVYSHDFIGFIKIVRLTEVFLEFKNFNLIASRSYRH